MSVTVCCYLWSGSRGFQPAYVNALSRMVKRYLPEPHRFICITDRTDGFCEGVEVFPEPESVRALGHLRTPEGSKFPSSYRRLWTFSSEAQTLGKRVLMLDIDCMIISDMQKLFRAKGDFIGWSVRPPRGCPPRFGGGTWLLRTGSRTAVYDEFVADPLSAMHAARSAGYRGSDQAWISYKLASVDPHWPEPSGIYCAQDCRKTWMIREPRIRRHKGRNIPTYTMKIRTGGLKVPHDAIIMHTNGAEGYKPWNSADPVVAKYWRPYA